MAVLTANAQRPVRLAEGSLRMEKLPLVGYTTFTTPHTVYKGSLMVSDADAADGYFRACPAIASVALTTDDVFGGIALERVDVTAADLANGSKEVTVARDGVWGFPKNSLAQTDIGAAVYAADDGQVVQSSSTDALWIGYLEGVDAVYAWVNIEPAFLRTNSAT